MNYPAQNRCVSDFILHFFIHMWAGVAQ